MNVFGKLRQFLCLKKVLLDLIHRYFNYNYITAYAKFTENLTIPDHMKNNSILHYN